MKNAILKHFEFFILVNLSILLMVSCSEKTQMMDLPPEVLPVVNELNEHKANFQVKAVDINNLGKIIGYSVTGEPLNRNYFGPGFGFYINSDKTGYGKIPAPEAYCVWPLSINDNGLLAGAWLPETENRNPGNFQYIPCQGFFYDSKTNEWQSFSVSGRTYTVLKDVNNSGIAWGYCGSDMSNLLDTDYFLYDTNTGNFIDFAPAGVTNYKIHAMNDQYLVVSYLSEPNQHSKIGHAAIYSLDDFSLVRTLPVAQIPDKETFFTDINSSGTIVGYWYGGEWTVSGLVYNLASNQFTFTSSISLKGSNFVEFVPYKINNNGKITGIARRINSKFPWPQSRAFIMNEDLSGFDDITPPNGDAYADAYSINNQNEIVGYAGFWQGSYILNRAFVVKK